MRGALTRGHLKIPMILRTQYGRQYKRIVEGIRHVFTIT